jgi:hypothetical protein
LIKILKNVFKRLQTTINDLQTGINVYEPIQFYVQVYVCIR